LCFLTPNFQHYVFFFSIKQYVLGALRWLLVLLDRLPFSLSFFRLALHFPAPPRKHPTRIKNSLVHSETQAKLKLMRLPSRVQTLLETRHETKAFLSVGRIHVCGILVIPPSRTYFYSK